jgi:ABC-type amino acid transport substrate-binding protein
MQPAAFSSSRRVTSVRVTLFTLLCFVLAAATATAFAGPTLDRIKQTGHIRLAYLGDARPFSFHGPSGPGGYAVALCKHIVQSLEKQLALQGLTEDWAQVSLERRLRQVAAGDIDILCAPTNETLGHRENVSFSIPIFAGGDRAVIRTDASPTLRNALSKPEITQPVWRGSPAATVLEQTTFVVMAGTATEKWLRARREFLRVNAKIETVPDYGTGLEHVFQRKADVFFGERSIVLGVLGTQDSAARQNLVIVDRLFTHEAIALALPRDDDEFRLLVDRALSQLYASAEFAKLYTQWCGEFDAPTRTLFQFAALAE